jgi:hypothetical protein
MPDRIQQFIAELASHNPDTVADILRIHVADERGKCKGCHEDDKIRKRWPCMVWAVADLARITRRASELGQQLKAG